MITPYCGSLRTPALPRAANCSNTCSYAVVANAAGHSTGEPKGSFSMTLSADGRCPRWERSMSTRYDAWRRNSGRDRAALLALAECGSQPGRRPERDPLGRTQQHRTARGKAGLLARWIPEAEIRSENALTNLAYRKEYDAVVTLRLGSREVTFALKYERTPKSRSKYDKSRRICTGKKTWLTSCT